MLYIKWIATAIILFTGVISLLGNKHSDDLRSTLATYADTNRYQIISKDEEAGDYQAFPDACRLQNGDIAVVLKDKGCYQLKY